MIYERGILHTIAESSTIDEAAAHLNMSRAELMHCVRTIRPGKVTPISKAAFYLRFIYRRKKSEAPEV